MINKITVISLSIIFIIFFLCLQTEIINAVSDELTTNEQSVNEDSNKPVLSVEECDCQYPAEGCDCQDSIEACDCQDPSCEECTTSKDYPTCCLPPPTNIQESHQTE